LGSKNGVVSFYTPNSSESVLKILAHNAIVKSVDFTKNGNYMSTIGSDNTLKIFDMRNYFKEIS